MTTVSKYTCLLDCSLARVGTKALDGSASDLKPAKSMASCTTKDREHYKRRGMRLAACCGERCMTKR